jgi:hypothetical protein
MRQIKTWIHYNQNNILFSISKDINISEIYVWLNKKIVVPVFSIVVMITSFFQLFF